MQGGPSFASSLSRSRVQLRASGACLAWRNGASSPFPSVLAVSGRSTFKPDFFIFPLPAPPPRDSLSHRQDLNDHCSRRQRSHKTPSEFFNSTPVDTPDTHSQDGKPPKSMMLMTCPCPSGRSACGGWEEPMQRIAETDQTIQNGSEHDESSAYERPAVHQSTEESAHDRLEERRQSDPRPWCCSRNKIAGAICDWSSMMLT